MVEIAEILPRLAIDQLVIGLLMINREGQICLFNQALARITGLNQHEFLGQSLYPPNKLLQTFATGREFQNLQPNTILPVMGLNNCAVSTQIVRGKSGVPVGAMAVFIPAGRQQELEEAVVKAEKLAILGQMAAEMVHEIRNPLTVMDGLIKLLQPDLQGTPKEEYVSIILAELKHVNHLITDFLQLSKPGYAKRSQCSITKVINEVTRLVENEAASRQLDLKMDLAGDIPDILGDSDQLKQVFLNILKNAFEALSCDGRIYLQTYWNRPENLVQVIIRDTGMGMDEQTRASMFDPFFTTKKNGTGLGMFIIKKLIDNHGGRIEIQSEPEKGTVVTVILPVG